MTKPLHTLLYFYITILPLFQAFLYPKIYPTCCPLKLIKKKHFFDDRALRDPMRATSSANFDFPQHTSGFVRLEP